MHLVDFNIEIYHDAQSYERQIWVSVNDIPIRNNGTVGCFEAVKPLTASSYMYYIDIFHDYCVIDIT